MKKKKNKAEAPVSGPLTKIAKEYAAIRREVEEAEDVLRPRKARLEDLKQRLIKQALAEEVPSFTVSNVGSFSVSSKPRVSIVEGKEDRLIAWLRKHGHEDLVQTVTTVRPADIGAMLEELDSTDLMSGEADAVREKLVERLKLIKIFDQDQLRFTKARSAASR